MRAAHAVAVELARLEAFDEDVPDPALVVPHLDDVGRLAVGRVEQQQLHPRRRLGVQGEVHALRRQGRAERIEFTGGYPSGHAGSVTPPGGKNNPRLCPPFPLESAGARPSPRHDSRWIGRAPGETSDESYLQLQPQRFPIAFFFAVFFATFFFAVFFATFFFAIAINSCLRRMCGL